MLPYTKKSQGLRMGKGKGNVDHFVAKLKKGDSIFELKRDLRTPNIENSVGNYPDS
jgi:ribosomal protein L16/L10AE